MVQRVRSHILEEESRIALKTTLPLSWVIRDQQPDYSIDAQVEIFDKNLSTGKLFGVQLKAVEKSKSKHFISKSFSTNHLRHFLNFQIPVLLVIYVVSEKKLYYEWTHKLFENASRDVQCGRLTGVPSTKDLRPV